MKSIRLPFLAFALLLLVAGIGALVRLASVREGNASDERRASAAPAKTQPDGGARDHDGAPTPDGSAATPARSASGTATGGGTAEPIATRGQPAIAKVRTETGGGREVELLPNWIGVFVPRPVVDPGTAVTVEVAYPEGNPGERVVASVEDGGDLADGGAVQLLELDRDRKVSFDFTAGANVGIYHITMRKGTDRKTVEVWAGAEPPLAE
jgi:hypothetical protein